MRRPVTVWIVGDGDRLFVRSTNGRSAPWFCAAVAAGSGQIVSGGTTFEVGFVEAEGPEVEAAHAAYRRKYGHYPSIVDHLVEDDPREATLQVNPA